MIVKILLSALAAALAAAPLDSAKESEWNQYRGPNRDGVSPDTGLLKQWPAGGPPLAWKATGIGAGFSSVSFSGSRLFTMGDVDGASCLLALNVADGKILWTSKVGKPGGSRWPGGRSTPATDGTLVFALGQHGEFACAEAESGKIRWQKDLVKDFGGKMMSGWGFSESPLLDGDLVLCTPGGSKGTVLALRKTTGEPVWQSSELTDSASYSSLVPVEIGGVRQYLVLTNASVAGVAAKDGKVLWQAERKGKTAVCTTPVYKDGILFVSSSYGIGHHAFKVTADGGKFKAEQIYEGRQMENHHGGLILVRDHLYGTDNRALKCIELKTGKVVWEDKCVGKGSVAYADGLLVVRRDDEKNPTGAIALVEATPEGYKEKGRFTQPDVGGEPTWANPVIFGGKLYIRDKDFLLCYDVKAK